MINIPAYLYIDRSLNPIAFGIAWVTINDFSDFLSNLETFMDHYFIIFATNVFMFPGFIPISLQLAIHKLHTVMGTCLRRTS